MEKILVTGGRGFLGSHIVKRLVESGYLVRILSRRQVTVNDQTQSESIDIICGDIRDRDSVNEAVSGVNRVIHLVSNFRKGGSDKHDAHSINVIGTENILKASSQFRVKQLIHCSTIGVHGNVRQIPADENTEFNPGDLYQETKLNAEKKVREYSKKNKLPVTVIRPISLIGPGDMRMLKLFKMIQKRRFIIVGDGSPFFQPAYIDDVVDGFMLCIDNEKAIGEVFIIGSDEYVTLIELFEIIAEELHVKAPHIKLPMKPVLSIAALCELMCVPLGIEPPLHRRRVSFFQNNRAFSIDKAKKVIGFQPKISLRDSIRRTIDWYQKHGYLNEVM